MKKKTRANLIMVIIICAIVACGVLGVGYIRGWFDSASDSTAMLTQIKGTVNMERGGVIYPVENDTVLRAGDRLTTLPGASDVIVLGSDTITLGGDVALIVEDPAAGSLALQVKSGEIFVNTEKAVQLSFQQGEVMVEKATVALSVRSGAQTVSVFRGVVGTVQAGQTMEYVGGEVLTSTLKLESLNDFMVAQIRKTNASVTLCVTNKDLDDLAAKRQQAIQDMLNGQTHTHSYSISVVAPTCTAEGYTQHICQCGHQYTDEKTAMLPHSWDQWKVVKEATTEEEGLRLRKCQGCDATEDATIEKVVESHTHSYEAEVTKPTCTTGGYTLYTCACGHSYTEDATSATGHTYTSQVVAPTCEAQGYTIHKCACGNTYTDGITAATGHHWGEWETVKEPTDTEDGLQERTCGNCGAKEQKALAGREPVGYVYLEIRCDTILNNMGDLTPGKAEFVPSNGVILPMVQVPFYENETVFEVLNRICKTTNIQIEYSWTPLYGSYYIEGINHLYEFDCGEQSGWMYKVNEWFPNYGCSSYELSDGDVIVWCYTCVGLGADVGDDWMNEG